MKINKSILAVLLGLGVASLANAGTVYITGSTACRASVYNTMAAANTVFSNTPAILGYGNKGNGDSDVLFRGSLYNGDGTSTDIVCHWSGSELGILNVVSNGVVNENFISDALIAAWDGVTVDRTNAISTTSHAVDCCLADNLQAYSRTKVPALPTPTSIGVVTFKWFRNNGNWTGSNVSDLQIRAAMNATGAKRALFDGDATHTNDYVYVQGRDNMSGTRVNAFADSGFGITSPAYQIKTTSETDATMLNFSLTTNPITHIVTTNAIGDWGQASGGTLGKLAYADSTASYDSVNKKTNGFSWIGYIGYSDWAGALAARPTLAGNELTYNGVAFSAANIKEGTYTFWGNEYLYTKASPSTEVARVATNIGANIDANADGSALIAGTAMHASRTAPTADPTHK